MVFAIINPLFHTFVSNSYPSGPSSTMIWLDDVEYNFDDLLLLSCRHGGIGDHNCAHSDDVAVECSGVIITSMFHCTVAYP